MCVASPSLGQQTYRPLYCRSLRYGRWFIGDTGDCMEDGLAVALAVVTGYGSTEYMEHV